MHINVYFSSKIQRCCRLEGLRSGSRRRAWNGWNHALLKTAVLSQELVLTRFCIAFIEVGTLVFTQECELSWFWDDFIVLGTRIFARRLVMFTTWRCFHWRKLRVFVTNYAVDEHFHFSISCIPSVIRSFSFSRSSPGSTTGAPPGGFCLENVWGFDEFFSENAFSGESPKTGGLRGREICKSN